MFVQYTTGHAIEPQQIMADLLTQFQHKFRSGHIASLVEKKLPHQRELRLLRLGSLLGHPGFDVVDLLRDAGGNPFGAVLGHEHVVLDTDADAAVFRRNQQIILAEVQTGLDGEDHAGRDLRALIGLIAGLRAIMHIKTQVVGHAAGEPTAVLLALRGQ